MPIDSIQLARFYRNTRSQSQRKAAHQPHIKHTTQGREGLDPSLSNQRVYKNRADWYVCFAINGMFDTDVAVKDGTRKYLLSSQIKRKRRKTGMNLYEQ